MKTWDDVMAVARGAGWSDDPMRLNVTGGIFHQAVTLVEMGQRPDERRRLMKCQLCWTAHTTHPSGYCRLCQMWLAWLKG